VVVYPLDYKHEFRKIISAELTQNETEKKYFDNWGSRCYLFDNELFSFPNGVLKNEKCCIKSLDFDFVQLRKMGCKYLISAVEITDLPKALSLKKILKNEKWKLRLYEIN
jgi:hypothetical protein